MSIIHKTGRLILLSFLTAGVLFSAASCKKKEEAAAPVARERVYAVVTQKAAVAKLQDSIEINGEVDVKTNVAIYPEIGGKLVSLTVEVGDTMNNNEWMVLMLCGALMELYTAFRIPAEIEKHGLR